MKILIVGLGKMGSQFVKDLLKDGHQVYVNDSDQLKVRENVALGAVSVDKTNVGQEFAGDKLVAWYMVPAAVLRNSVLGWVSSFPAGSIVVDGGNSNYKDTKSLANELLSSGVDLLDVGTSGGVLGLKNGFSLMVGGNKSSYDYIVPALKSLSSPQGKYHYFGPSGTGHYVKMVHNAIEYGYMESLAEGYRLLKEGPYDDLELSEVANLWQHGSIVQSLINELAGEILRDNPDLNGIDGYVAETGEAKWSLGLAKELNIDMPAIEAAFKVRIESQTGKVTYTTKLLAAIRNKFGGHDINPKDEK